MNQHKDCLLKVCRLCGEHRANQEDRNPVLKEHFASDIKAALDISIAGDVVGIHPPHICKPCELKLRRWKANTAKRKKAVCNIQVVTFSASECGECASEKTCTTLADHRAKADQFSLMVWRGEDRLRIFKMDGVGNPIVFFYNICQLHLAFECLWY